MSRRDKFRQAAKARQAQKEQENGQYEDIAYVPLVKNRQVPLRFVGLPHDVREEGTDIRLLLMALIRDDQGKWVRVVFPEDREWIMYRIYKTVCEYKWDEENNAPDYLHSDLDIFKTVRYNDMPAQKRRMQKGWWPQAAYLVNVVDRSDPDWHAENNHTKVIAKKKNVKEDNVYYTPGLPVSAYKSIQDDIQRHDDNIDWEEYDIVVEKLDSEPWYKVYHGEKDSHRLDDEVSKLIVPGELTEEERNYEMYDFDKLFPVTQYRKLLNRLRLKIKDVDEAFDTRYLEELEDLAAAEKREKDKEKKRKAASEDDPDDVEDQASSSDSDDYDDEDDESVREKAPARKSASREEAEEEEPAPARRRRRKPEPEPEEDTEEEFSIESLKKTYPGVKGLSEDMQALIIGVNEDGSLQYDTDEELLPCPSCDFESPEEFDRCPKCGVEFEE